MKIFTKSILTGQLGLVTIDHCVNRRGKIAWTTKQVLMLVDKQGAQLSSAQFRSNAFKKAENFFIDCGWFAREEKNQIIHNVIHDIQQFCQDIDQWNEKPFLIPALKNHLEKWHESDAINVAIKQCFELDGGN